MGLIPRIAVLPHFETFGHRWVDSAVESAPADDVTLVGVDVRTAALRLVPSVVIKDDAIYLG